MRRSGKFSLKTKYPQKFIQFSTSIFSRDQMVPRTQDLRNGTLVVFLSVVGDVRKDSPGYRTTRLHRYYSEKAQKIRLKIWPRNSRSSQFQRMMANDLELNNTLEPSLNRKWGLISKRNNVAALYIKSFSLCLFSDLLSKSLKVF